MARNKNHKSPTLSFETLGKHCKRFDNAINGTIEKFMPFMACRVHVQKTNVKTAAMGEGTAALHTCVHGNWHDWTASGIERGIGLGKLPPCARSCYALRQMIQYPNYAAAMIRNTILRRTDAKAYYELFFERAQRAGNLRLNESGDFETAQQARFALDLARDNPDIRVWGYTQQNPSWIADSPKNCVIRVSCWTDEKRAEKLEAQGFKTACVTEDATKVNCPAQLAQRNGKVWHCADCAKRHCGCCGDCKRIYFAKH